MRMIGLAAYAALATLCLPSPPTTAAELRVGMLNDFSSLDPHAEVSGPNFEFNINTYDALTTIAPDGALAPQLATSWSVDKDAVTWTFKIRSGVTFQDGTPLTAADVKASIERMLALKTTIPFAGYIRTITSLELIDPLTLRIVTSAPDPRLPEGLGFATILKGGAPGIGTDMFNAVKTGGISTGPYIVQSYRSGDTTVLVRNDHYWGGTPAWDKVTIRAIKNDASRVAALLAHDVDFIEAVPPADFPRLQGNTDIVAVAFPGARTPYIAMDQSREQSPDITDKKGMPIRNPFLDWRVRKAMDLAIDRNAIVARVFDGLADKTSQVEPPGQIAHSDGLDASPIYTEYNPEKARALLADAGYPQGFKVKLNTPDTGYLGASAYVQALGQMFTRIGVDTEVNVLPRSVFVKSWFAGDYGFAINSYGGTNLEPDRSILAVLHSKSARGDYGIQNGGRFANPKIDLYYLLGSREMDHDMRVAYYRAAQEATVQDVNLIMTHRPRLLWAMRKGLQFRQYPAEEYFRLNEIRAAN